MGSAVDESFDVRSLSFGDTIWINTGEGPRKARFLHWSGGRAVVRKYLEEKRGWKSRRQNVMPMNIIRREEKRPVRLEPLKEDLQLVGMCPHCRGTLVEQDGELECINCGRTIDPDELQGQPGPTDQ